MKTIKVVAAIICDSLKEKTKIFATARGYGEFKGQWEFPGGKIEEGKTSEEALVREIKEELETEIRGKELIHTVEYDYPTFHISMDCFWCEIIKGDLVLIFLLSYISILSFLVNLLIKTAPPILCLRFWVQYIMR